ncbi:MAG TPA: AraC family transcriptional regulator [Candidatus Acidoferrum sp.]|nr:AraC family transcriptional regulator [Candidatus Acidoferrum sp.]
MGFPLLSPLPVRSFLDDWRIESLYFCDLLECLYNSGGEDFLAKIAAELERALARRAANGEPGRMAARVLGQGDGWHVADVVCTCGPQDRPFEEQHDYATVAIVVAGTFQYRGSLSRCGMGQDLMTPGSLLLGNAGQCFECGHEHALGDRCLSFRYSHDYFEGLAADAGMQRGQRSFRVHRLPPLRPLSRAVAQACLGLIRGADARWEELGVRLAAEALRLANGRLAEAGSMPPSAVARVTRAVRMIDLHADGELPLGTLAKESGLSTYHFLRTFQQVTGLTPHQYVRRARLRKAAVRLASEPEKVLDIALDCGFGDVSNFNRAFRAEFGGSPRTYRARQ